MNAVCAAFVADATSQDSGAARAAALGVFQGLSVGGALCGNQISGAPRHRRDVVPMTASGRWRGGNLTHWLISHRWSLHRRLPHGRDPLQKW
jgi:hypothetical protein